MQPRKRAGVAGGLAGDSGPDDGLRRANAVALELRVGMASGPAVGGVIGSRRIVFDLWGDTVNVAARMESSGVPG